MVDINKLNFKEVVEKAEEQIENKEITNKTSLKVVLKDLGLTEDDTFTSRGGSICIRLKNVIDGKFIFQTKSLLNKRSEERTWKQAFGKIKTEHGSCKVFVDLYSKKIMELNSVTIGIVKDGKMRLIKYEDE